MFFFDNFSGTNLNPLWQASLPDAPLGSFPGPLVATYDGAPNFSFQILSNIPVLRMTNFMGPDLRHGWVLSTIILTDNFRYEVRFNTVNQSSTNSIDAFIEIWLLDSSNPANYDIVEPYSEAFGSDFYAFADSSIDCNYMSAGYSTIDGIYSRPGYSHTNSTWYRLALEGEKGQNIRASLCDDNERALVTTTFRHGADTYSAGLNIALSQAIGGSRISGLYPDDVAVSYALVTAADLPPMLIRQPQGRTTGLGSNVTLNVSAAGDGPLSYQWYFKTQALTGKTNPTLTLTNLQFSNVGSYSVTITNAFGTNVSASVFISITNLPQLSVQVDANVMLLFWPTSALSVLETSTNIASTNWIRANPITIGDQSVYSAPLVDPRRFFRLRYTAP